MGTRLQIHQWTVKLAHLHTLLGYYSPSLCRNRKSLNLEINNRCLARLRNTKSLKLRSELLTSLNIHQHGKTTNNRKPAKNLNTSKSYCDQYRYFASSLATRFSHGNRTALHLPQNFHFLSQHT